MTDLKIIEENGLRFSPAEDQAEIPQKPLVGLKVLIHRKIRPLNPDEPETWVIYAEAKAMAETDTKIKVRRSIMDSAVKRTEWLSKDGRLYQFEEITTPDKKKPPKRKRPKSVGGRSFLQIFSDSKGRQ